jgi:hypothetical protein
VPGKQQLIHAARLNRIRSNARSVGRASFPAWQADGLLEEFDMYRRGEAAEIESGVTEALGRRPRPLEEFARDYAALFA